MGIKNRISSLVKDRKNGNKQKKVTGAGSAS